MPDSIDSLASQITALKLKVDSFDFRITSMQLTINQFDTKFNTINVYQIKNDVDALKKEVVTVDDGSGAVTLGQYLNGKNLEVIK